MRVYNVANVDNPVTSYSGTKSEAHEAAKKFPKADYRNIKITEFDVATDKDGVLAMLNGEPSMSEVQAWGLTPRGGLTAWKED